VYVVFELPRSALSHTAELRVFGGVHRFRNAKHGFPVASVRISNTSFTIEIDNMNTEFGEKVYNLERGT
jgi:hypothetical protein